MRRAFWRKTIWISPPRTIWPPAMMHGLIGTWQLWERSYPASFSLIVVLASNAVPLAVVALAWRAGKRQRTSALASRVLVENAARLRVAGPDDGRPEGAVAGPVSGTHWHGAFESDEFRRRFLTLAARQAGRPGWKVAPATSFADVREKALDVLGDLVEEHLDTDALWRLLDEGAPAGLFAAAPPPAEPRGSGPRSRGSRRGGTPGPAG